MRWGHLLLRSVVHLISRLRRQLPLIGEAFGMHKTKASPGRGGGSAKPRRRGRRKFVATSQSASQTAPLKGEPWIFAPRKKVQIIQIFTVPSIDGNRSKATSIKFDTPVSGGAYQNIRKVTIVWNDACNIGSCLSSDAESTKRIPAPFSPLSFPAQGKR